MAAATDYSTYLRIDDLLNLQQPLTPGAHDEMLFIVVHQVYELWFKLILVELDRAVACLHEADPVGAVAPLRRVTAVEELMLDQLRLLETMSPYGFLQFRDPLAPASGFQSTQYREIEELCGRIDVRHATAVGRTREQRARLEQRAGEPTLWDSHVGAMHTRGIVTSNSADDVLTGLVALYRDHSEPLRGAFHQVCELLIDHDEAFARWRFHHALMAAREIGRREGTGGSLGVAYLDSTLDQRFFPLLWEVRSHL